MAARYRCAVTYHFLSLLERLCHILQSSKHKHNLILNSDNSLKSSSRETASLESMIFSQRAICASNVRIYSSKKGTWSSKTGKILQSGLFNGHRESQGLAFPLTAVLGKCWVPLCYPGLPQQKAQYSTSSPHIN